VAVIEPLLLCVARISTFAGTYALTAAGGFFFEREERLFPVTGRHVLVDQPSGPPPRWKRNHHAHGHRRPHAGRRGVASALQRSQKRLAPGAGLGGDIDVAAIELDRRRLPADVALRAFTMAHLQGSLAEIGIGTALLVVGFPLGFFDTRHNPPVARHAVVASAFGVRFQGQGYFLTDARMHRGTSGAPVVLHHPTRDASLPWKLLGIHSARLDVRTREEGVDESLGLNCAWYADILDTLTR
jgi:Trypsin-like peptidase domain